jgi:hypothetical protein
MNASNFYTWQAIAMQLATHPWGTTLRIEKYRVQHPRDAGMKPSTGLPVGQRQDWRVSYPTCGGLHVRDFGDYYSAHLDRVNPNCDPIGHVVSDTPQIAGGVALGALLGLALGKSKEAALVGALFGGLLGVASATSQVESSPTPAPARPRHAGR